MQGVKKPYNPILGEIFRAQWDHGSSKSFYVSEQVRGPRFDYYCNVVLTTAFFSFCLHFSRCRTIRQ